MSYHKHYVMSNPKATQRQYLAPLKLYSKHNIETIHPHQLSHPQHKQSSKLEVNILESESKFSDSSQSDLDIPIAHRKGIRSCTQIPTSKFVSYEKINPHYKAFIYNIYSLEVPKNKYSGSYG